VKEAFAAAQKKFQTESAGLASNEDGEDATLNDQLIGEDLGYLYLLIPQFKLSVCVTFNSITLLQ